MYEPFYSLNEVAFSMTPDPRFLWLSETHEEGLAALCYGIKRRRGFLLLTGEVGMGKTTLLRAAIDRLPDDELDVPEIGLLMGMPQLSPLDLLKFIAVEFRLAGPFQTTADYVIALNAFLLERLRDGLNTILIIDEAQNLDRAALEQVRLLSNLETDAEKLLQIVLVGQPELARKLTSPGLRQLRQRIAIEHHLRALEPGEVEAYLRHRIEVAGGSYEKVFEPGAEKTFFEFSAGCPRLVNLLADRALLAGYAKQLRPLPRALVEAKATELAASRGARVT
jgi:general secretion pathway protein A